MSKIKLIHYAITYLGPDGNISHSEEGVLLYKGKGDVPKEVRNQLALSKCWETDVTFRITFRKIKSNEVRKV